MPKHDQMQFDWIRGDGGSVAVTASADAEQRKPLSQETLPGIPVAEDPTPQSTMVRTRRAPTVLPVPKPLPVAVGRRHFGEYEHGPIRPSREEVRAITEDHAERLVNLLEGLAEVDATLGNSQCSDRARLYHEKDRLLSSYQSKLALYAEDFGEAAARRLDMWARHEFRKEGRR